MNSECADGTTPVLASLCGFGWAMPSRNWGRAMACFFERPHYPRFRISKLSLISSIIAKLKGKDSLVSEDSFTEKLMMAKLLYATESFVDFDAEELEQFVPRRFGTQLAKRAHLIIQRREYVLSDKQVNGSVTLDPSLPSFRLSYIQRNTPTAADGSES